MEYIDIISDVPFVPETLEIQTVQNESSIQPFIEANTIPSSLADIKKNHIIPVYIKDNETLISHTDFIEATLDAVNSVYCNEQILQPIVRVSHPMKGRIPEARNKPASELLEHEKTLYYERMAFAIEIPSIQGVVGDNTLSLTVGGVKSFNQDNLYNKKGSDEHFHVFIGFQNKVCTNMKIWSDGFMGNLKVSSMGQLSACIRTLVERYSSGLHLHQMQQLTKYRLTDKQFATIIGKCRMYQHLPYDLRKDITPLLMGDTQIGMVCKEYFKNNDFNCEADGSIDLWRFYNLFTGANKSTYIDSFLNRSVNAYNLVEQIRYGLDNTNHCWYLS
jgi:hypothetical protein